MELASLATTVMVFEPLLRFTCALQLAVAVPLAVPPLADAPFTVTEEIPLFPVPESVAVPDTVIGLLVTVMPVLLGTLMVRLGASESAIMYVTVIV